MQIRLARQEDSVAVVEIIKRVFDEYGFTWEEENYHADLYDLDQHYFDLGHLFWIAETDEGAPIGTVALSFFETLPGAPDTTIELDGEVRLARCDCALNRLYVKPDSRKLGAGSVLMKTVIAAAKAKDCQLMEIWSDKRFGDAHRLYERFGAKMIGDRICDDPDVSPEWGLILEL
ncbi:MAG TPA: GNAT family N-acetyltransferase [Fimbriimonadaceae bacterium]|jgi:putative acetyltransferase